MTWLHVYTERDNGLGVTCLLKVYDVHNETQSLKLVLWQLSHGQVKCNQSFTPQLSYQVVLDQLLQIIR